MKYVEPIALLSFILACVSVILFPWFVSLPLFAITAGLSIYHFKKQGYRAIWRNNRLLLTQEREEFPEMAPPRLRLVNQSDRHFSAIHFLDFARLLYEEFLKARFESEDKLKELAHFIDPQLLTAPPPGLGLKLVGQDKPATMEDGHVEPESAQTNEQNQSAEQSQEAEPTSPSKRDGAPPTELFIGPANIHTVDLGDPNIEVVFEFGTTIKRNTSGEPDLSQSADNDLKEFYACEKIVFKRSTKALSKDGEKMRQLCCPTCDKALDAKQACDHAANPGEKQWYIAALETLAYLPLKEFDATPAQSRGTTEIQSPVDMEELVESERRFIEENPKFDVEKLKSFTKRCFLELLDAWSTKHWERARAFMTKTLHSSHYIELERYKRNGWTNHIKDPEIQDIVPVKFAKDPHHHLVTLWITARAIDYTTDADSKLLAGDDKRKIVFHEYWTFIRRHDVGKPGEETLTCPLCKIDVGPAAPRFCKHCADNFHDIEFEWTLAALGPDSTEWT